MAKHKVIGFKRFKGTVDGNAIDSAKLFCEVKLDSRRNGADQRAEGIAVEEFKVPAELLKRIEHTPLPFFVEFETERVSNGREARDVVVGLQLVEPVKLAKAA